MSNCFWNTALSCFFLLSHLMVKGPNVWCQGCGHGGHLIHMQEWFSKHIWCPAGCGHMCEYTWRKGDQETIIETGSLMKQRGRTLVWMNESSQGSDSWRDFLPALTQRKGLRIHLVARKETGYHSTWQEWRSCKKIKNLEKDCNAISRAAQKTVKSSKKALMTVPFVRNAWHFK